MASATAEPRSEYALAVVQRGAAELIGFGWFATDLHQQCGAPFGFVLRPDTWGVTYGLETVRILLGWGFDELHLHRAW